MYQNETIYYPQDEMNTPLLPVTNGCPYDQCTFCSMYKGSIYSEVPFSDIVYELKNMDPYTERIFLVGADPLHIGYEKMLLILKEIKKQLPYCACVASYAAVRSLKQYTLEELSSLHEHGLRLLYVGFESGSEEILHMIHKGHTVEDAVRQGQKLNEAHLLFNAIIMYGIAEHDKIHTHAVQTAKMLNQMNPHKIITMNLTLFTGTILYNRAENGLYTPTGRQERIEELKLLISSLHPCKKVLLDTTHPTNIVRVRGFLPDETEKILKKIK